MLELNVVIDRYLRKIRPIEWRRHVAGRRRQSVAQQIWNDDEILLRIQSQAVSDQPFILNMRVAKSGWIDDDIILFSFNVP